MANIECNNNIEFNIHLSSFSTASMVVLMFRVFSSSSFFTILHTRC